MTERWQGRHVFDQLVANQAEGILNPQANKWGQHFYVDPVSGSDSYNGRSPDKAKQTLDAAIGLCTAYRGDVIWVKKGTQTVTSAVEFDVHGITVIAESLFNPMGNGEAHTVYGSHTDGPAAVITKPCNIIGLGFVGSDADGPSLLIDCEESGGYDGGFNWLYRCRFSQWGIAKYYAIKSIGGAVNLIDECTFDGLFTGWGVAAISLQNDVGGQAPFDTVVRNNMFFAGGDGKYCIEFATGAVPNGVMIYGNKNVNGAGMTTKFLDSNGVSGKCHIFDNWPGGATDTGSYDTAVATMQGYGYQISGNHYSE